MIHSIIRLKLDMKSQSEAVRVLLLNAERTRSKAGCIKCALYRSLEDDALILVEQLWRSQDDLHSHLRSKDYQNLLLVVEMAQSEPEIEFNTIISSDGIDAVKRARALKSARKIKKINPEHI